MTISLITRISAAPTLQPQEPSKIVVVAVKVRTEVVYGKQYVSVIRQHSPADTLGVA